MSRRGSPMLKAALLTLHYSGVCHALKPVAQGMGAIFMLHHVRPERDEPFEPNRILSVTPDFLDDVIRRVKASGYDIVSLDEAHHRLTAPGEAGRFACFTLDDGYRDNLVHAYPVFKRHRVPFTIYVPGDYPDGKADLWWLALERIVNRATSLPVEINGELRLFPAHNPETKTETYHALYWWLRSLDETVARETVARLGRGFGVDPVSVQDGLMLTWDEIRALAKDSLVTIGAHTKGHFALAKLTAAEAREEIVAGIDRLERELGRRPDHMSYPYGCPGSAGEREFALARELGLKTAVTTRKGLIHAEHRERLTALPRVSLNGDFQDLRFVSALLSGTPFLIWNRLKRVS